MIEQVPWDKYAGQVTKSVIVAYLQAMMYGHNEPEPDCPLNSDRSFSTMVLAYPRDPDLDYRIALTHGELSARTVTGMEFTEVVNVRLENTVRLRYPAREIVSIAFMDVVYDETGAVVDPPAVAWNGAEIELSSPVYGALEVTYRLLVHGYEVTVPERDEAVESRYSSVLYARWDGGVTWLELNPPPGAEENGDAGADCWWPVITGTVSGPDDPDSGPTDTHANRVIRVDYCSGEIISDTTYAY